MVDEGVAGSGWLTIAQAAKFVGVSPATLRRWDSDGKLTAVRRPGSKYRYYRPEDLEPFRLEHAVAGTGAGAVDGFFAQADAHVADNPQLREPQRYVSAPPSSLLSPVTGPLCLASPSSVSHVRFNPLKSA